MLYAKAVVLGMRPFGTRGFCSAFPGVEMPGY
jgi:hypothetical protein